MSCPNLLILESGFQDVREYWLQDLKAQGYQLYLAQPWPLSWEAPYVEDYLQCQLNKWGAEQRSLITSFCRKHQIQGILALTKILKGLS